MKYELISCVNSSVSQQAIILDARMVIFRGGKNKFIKLRLKTRKFTFFPNNKQ